MLEGKFGIIPFLAFMKYHLQHLYRVRCHEVLNCQDLYEKPSVCTDISQRAQIVLHAVIILRV